MLGGPQIAASGGAFTEPARGVGISCDIILRLLDDARTVLRLDVFGAKFLPVVDPVGVLFAVVAGDDFGSVGNRTIKRFL